MIRKMITALCLAAGLAVPAAADPLAKDVFGAFRQAAGGPPVSIGFYSKGCAQGLVQLPQTGPGWQAMRLSRNRNWGHPQLVDVLMRLSQAAQQAGWRGIYVGDMSQPRGGPMTSGHASHQIGLDADVWMLPPPSLSLSAADREKISSQSVVAKGGLGPSRLWSRAHMQILRAAAKDPRVQRIFVDPVAKVEMCKTAGSDRAWLRKIRPLNNHDYHFHIRLSCPAGSLCTPQAAVPPGDGCAEAAKWLANRANPPKKQAKPDPNYRHPRSFRLNELPPECRSVAGSR